jgi:protoheme IX farnesyltransferase
MTDSGHESVTQRPGTAKNRLRDLVSLTKPRITLMVLISAGAGFLLGSAGRARPLELLLTALGIGLVAGGTPGVAALFSVAVSLAGIAVLAVFVNLLTALLAAVALVSYVAVYTPLKRVSSLSTLVGAVPGALPIMGGWTAATGTLDPGAWALFGILFFWQLPHFLALAWMYRDDYQRGGLRMLGVFDPEGRQTRQQSVLYALALVPVSLLPVLLGLTGTVYPVAALALTGAYVASALRFAVRADSPTARGLFRVSLVYLPLLLMLLTLDGRVTGGSGVTGDRDEAVTTLVP